jgi:ABC-type transport system involved in multi-copper enzyme maturation permease subunit
MLWYKAWLETRWRFLIGLALLLVGAGGVVVEYPTVNGLMPLATSLGTGDGIVGRAVQRAVEFQSTYPGYVWWNWFAQSLPHLWIFFAAIIGTGGLVAQAATGESLFTLSLPASRNELLATRATVGLGELLVLAFVPSLVVPSLSPAIGQSYAVGDTLIFGSCLFVAGSMFFSLAFLLSTVFEDVWRPALITCGLAILVAGYESLLPRFAPYGVFYAMTGEGYLTHRALPWSGLTIGVALSVLFLYGATLGVARRDF